MPLQIITMGCATLSQAAAVHLQPRQGKTSRRNRVKKNAATDNYECASTITNSSCASGESLQVDRVRKGRRRFSSNYRMGRRLGEGAFAVVNECRNKRSRATAAVKIVPLKQLPHIEIAALKDEIELMEELRHPNIVGLHDVCLESECYYLVMEKVTGGDMFNRVKQRGHYDEKQARGTFVNLLKAVQYCHAHNVVHRDLKPENLLLANEEPDSEAKLADFGFAAKALTPNSLTTRCGSPEYVSPEVIKGIPYGTQADMWSLGVTLYFMLAGRRPFEAPSHRELFRKIKSADYDFLDKPWGSVSENAKDFVEGLLTVDPDKRLSAAAALNHRWVRDSALLASTDLCGMLYCEA